MPDGFHVKRAYDEPANTDGYRVLVDGLWPRGVSKERADLDEWAKDVAPSPDLRQWFHHDPGASFAGLTRRYKTELAGERQQEGLRELRSRAARQPVTLITSEKDLEHSHVAILLDALCSRRMGGNSA
ncbi:DUF488 domain-containing protein [Nocardia sp. NPDC058480]|uniref:DUF488 domain-containing protein n=1 Tax=unclassified Nocardia TaxID=2637762 RepID=UPI0036481622